jgi:pSer/pThr/pTyr-binding forkhead associated (FHA) protein
MPVARILVTAGPRAAELGATELVIGRSVYCTLVIEHPSVSRVHASIRRVGENIELVDHGSSNGTFVNKQRLGSEPVIVKPDDKIEIGDVAVHLMLVESTPAGRVVTMAGPRILIEDTREDVTTGIVRKPGG